ncbi:MAG: glycosyltransferase, partial [bacterium]|nr:glycosyltransferase [bacterium]
LESMACKTPVIAANTGSLPEIVGASGVMIDPYDVLDTSRVIEKFWNIDKIKYIALQDKSYIQSKKFLLQKMINETISVYESI